MYVDNETVQLARKADLYAFLLGRHGDLFRRCGQSIYMKQNNSLYIKSGFYGYRDFSTGETGNGIDFLTRHLGYSFQEAVLALAGFRSVPGPVPASSYEDKAGQTQRPFPLPVPAPLPHKRMFAYLISRGIPGSVIRYLTSMGLIYQEQGTGNIVFINREKDYCELRGTFTYAEKQFHGCQKTWPDRFWYFIPEAAKPLRALSPNQQLTQSACGSFRKTARTQPDRFISVSAVQRIIVQLKESAEILNQSLQLIMTVPAICVEPVSMNWDLSLPSVRIGTRIFKI